MDGSLDRVRAVIRGGTPDRPPLYELLRNDAVIEHFSGQALTVAGGTEAVYRAYAPAVDATRPAVRAPAEEASPLLDDGRRQRQCRWTTWTEPRRYADGPEYAAAKRALVDAFDASWSAADQTRLAEQLAGLRRQAAQLGEVFFFVPGPGPGLMGLYGEVGLEQFCYYLVDHPDLICAQLECNVQRALTWIEHLPPDHGIEAVFCGDDLAFRSGPLLSPR